jgi:hypothetical protein
LLVGAAAGFRQAAIRSGRDMWENQSRLVAKTPSLVETDA